ncbi:MAG: cyclic pyranopterin monophosphate synthase MoaC [Gemmatimonadales bacterium]|nr:cyclic pyranopterin monophosphate synthase MoaC [Gemmatimonadales bacterium]
MSLTHVDEQGRARMVDVTAKPVTERTAVAEGFVRMAAEAFALVEANGIAKGDVRGVAELAGVMGAKQTGALIPLCHPLPLDLVRVECALDPALPGVRVTALARTAGRTGVEMEALTAVAVACLTVYDMVKAVDRSLEVGGIRLLSKTGGTRGDWQAPARASATASAVANPNTEKT